MHKHHVWVILEDKEDEGSLFGQNQANVFVFTQRGLAENFMRTYPKMFQPSAEITNIKVSDLDRVLTAQASYGRTRVAVDPTLAYLDQKTLRISDYLQGLCSGVTNGHLSGGPGV